MVSSVDTVIIDGADNFATVTGTTVLVEMIDGTCTRDVIRTCSKRNGRAGPATHIIRLVF